MSAKNKDKPDETDKPLAEKVKGSWEYRVGKIILRTAAALFFIGYAFAAAPMAWTWSWSTYYKNQPISALDKMIRQTLPTPDQSELLAWINLRDKTERDIIREKLEPYTAYLDPFLFLFYSKWAVEELEAEEIIFWHMYARYRLRFDALRCGAPDSVINMQGILALMQNGHIDAILARWPHLLKPALERVLDYDAQYPASNNPARICEVIYKIEGFDYTMVRQTYWASIRHTLRKQTELELEMMDETGRMRPLRPSPAPAKEPSENKETE